MDIKEAERIYKPGMVVINPRTGKINTIADNPNFMVGIGGFGCIMAIVIIGREISRQYILYKNKPAEIINPIGMKVKYNNKPGVILSIKDNNFLVGHKVMFKGEVSSLKLYHAAHEINILP